LVDFREVDFYLLAPRFGFHSCLTDTKVATDTFV
jgi:hypothetical protein